MAVTDARRRKDPTQSRCGNCLPEFDLIFKLAKNVQFHVVSVLKEILPEKNTSHTPLHVIWAISFFKSVKIKTGGQHAQPVHQVWQLLHFLKNVKINLGRRAPPLHPNMGNGQKKKCFLWKVFPQSHTKSNFKMNYENMNYGKNKIDCNDGHSSMSGHFCILICIRM